MKRPLLFFAFYSFGIFNVLAQAKQDVITGPSGVPQHDGPINKTLNITIGEAGNAVDFDMAPETTPTVVEAAVKQIHAKVKPAAGPVDPAWESIKANYKVPEWFKGVKFGLFMHWGLYSVPAYHNEWYEKHMYAGFSAWHTEHFGPQDKFGYMQIRPAILPMH